MATTKYMEAYSAALGKLIVEREGLDLNKVSKDWEAEGSSTGPIVATLHIPVTIPRAEWDAMTAAANAAAQEQVNG